MNHKLLLLALLIFTSSTALTYADEATETRAAVQTIFPSMIQAINSGDFDKARDLCLKIMALQPIEPVHRYNLACIEAKAGNAAEAIAALKQAISLGYSDAANMQNDPDLTSIRRHPLFGDLVDGAARNAQTAPVVPAAPAAPDAPPAVVPGGNDNVPQPQYTATGPVGPYFMTRYWSFTQTLEKTVWYFSPDGRAYTDLKTGLTAADLAAHRGRQGTFRLEGAKLVVRWNDGKVEQSAVERDQNNATTFMWSMGIFSPIAPFANAQAIAGHYEGGEAVGPADSRVASAQTIDLNADGTFTQSGIGMVRGATEGVNFDAGSTSTTTGTWQLSGYSLILAGGDGNSARRLAFPFDDPDTAVNPDRVFIGWLMFKKN
jgi:hypothetical protein